MSRLARILLPLLLPVSVLATTQNPDTLIIGSGRRDVYGIELPKNVVARLHTWKRKNNLEGVSSANWKGFYATLRLANKQLFLDAVSVDGAGLSTVRVPVRILFAAEPPIRALWFSGQLTEYHSAPGLRSIRAELSSNLQRRYTFRDGELVSIRTEPIPR